MQDAIKATTLYNLLHSCFLYCHIYGFQENQYYGLAHYVVRRKELKMDSLPLNFLIQRKQLMRILNQIELKENATHTP